LLKFENVIITPYCAWYTEESIVNLRETIANEIARVLSGFYPQVIVNPDVKLNARAGHLKEGQPR
jgi:D-3-phosphoglycerate dehydrogenase